MINQKSNKKGILLLLDEGCLFPIFPTSGFSNNIKDDVEWILTRNEKFRKGVALGVVDNNGKGGIWIGKYDNNQIKEVEIISGNETKKLIELLKEYERGSIPDKTLKITFAIGLLKMNPEIFHNLKFQELRKGLTLVKKYGKLRKCTNYLMLYECPEIRNLYDSIVKKHGKGRRIFYHLVAREIKELIRSCPYVSGICPLKSQNEFERVYNFYLASQTRGLEEITMDGLGIVFK